MNASRSPSIFIPEGLGEASQQFCMDQKSKANLQNLSSEDHL